LNSQGRGTGDKGQGNSLIEQPGTRDGGQGTRKQPAYFPLTLSRRGKRRTHQNSIALGLNPRLLKIAMR